MNSSNELEASCYSKSWLYLFLTWRLPPLQQYLWLGLSQLFFYLYAFRGHSLLSFLSLYLLARILWGLLTGSNSSTSTSQ